MAKNALKKPTKSKTRASQRPLSFKDLSILVLTGNRDSIATFFAQGRVSRASLRRSVNSLVGNKNYEMYKAFAERLIPGVMNGKGRPLPRSGETRTYRTTKNKGQYIRIPTAMLGKNQKMKVIFDNAVIRVVASE